MEGNNIFLNTDIYGSKAISNIIYIKSSILKIIMIN